MVLDPIKHVLQVFLNGFKHNPGKAYVKRVHNNDAFVNVEKLAYEKTTAYLCGVFYQLKKHPILIRRRFIDIKSLHMMYYRPFDINEFLKLS